VKGDICQIYFIKMEAKRMRFSSAHSNSSISAEKLELKIWQNNLISKCDDENYINRLLDTTRNLLVASEQLTVHNVAISSAISSFGLKKSPYLIHHSSGSDDLSLPSTSSQSSSRQHSSSSTSPSTDAMTLESEAIECAINSYGLHTDKQGI